MREVDRVEGELYEAATRYCAQVGDHDNRLFFEGLLEEERRHGEALAAWLEALRPGADWVRPLAAAGGAAVEFLESMLQLVVNTISFVRVGAFALAHAGLSMAVVGLADAAGSVILTAIILLLGNVLIIALEGLVVAIQTTRLVLFEFFIHFFQGEGREFRPADRPPESGQQESSGEPRGP